MGGAASYTGGEYNPPHGASNERTFAVSHTTKGRAKLLTRVRRIRGQVESLERDLSEGKDCTAILQQIAACRGAINGLMAEVLEGHIREHLIDPSRAPSKAEAEALDELAEVVKRYLK